MMDKGIILAGGTGTRLYPITSVANKQLLPVYDKPLIYYPLSVLMLLGIRHILIIGNADDLPLYQDLLDAGDHLGITIAYKAQPEPRGLPEAFTLGKDFIGDDPVTMILGDNIFYGAGLVNILRQSILDSPGATAFAYKVRDPERFGIASFDPAGDVTKLEEKPQKPQSSWALTGLYHFAPDVADKASGLAPSARGELEMIDLLNLYLAEERLHVARLPRGHAWLDVGTSEALVSAGQYIQILEERQGIKISSPEEIAYRKGFIDQDQLAALAETMHKSAYGQYLKQILREVV